MKGFLRRLRGVIGTGLTWALGWGAVSTVLQLGASVFLGSSLGSLLAVAVSGTIQGFIAGSSFAVILSIAERRRTLDQLSLKRVALWGGLGAIGLFLLLVPRLIAAGLPLEWLVISYLFPLGLTGLLGAGFASGSVALARRGDANLIEGEESPQLLEGD